MAKNYVVSIEIIELVGESYKTFRPSMLADGKTTMQEIEDFFDKYHMPPTTEISIIELQDKNEL